MPTKPDTTTSDDRDTVIDVRGLSVHFDLQGSSSARLLGIKSGTVKAVDDVDLTLRRGEVVGLVGESGSGKSTLGRALLGLVGATAGSVLFDGRDLTGMGRRELRGIRKHIQMVFQDPNAALNPSMTVEERCGSKGSGLRPSDVRGWSRRWSASACRRSSCSSPSTRATSPGGRSNGW